MFDFFSIFVLFGFVQCILTGRFSMMPSSNVVHFRPIRRFESFATEAVIVEVLFVFGIAERHTQIAFHNV